MKNNVDIKTIFIRLMDRLADFAANADEDVHSYNTELDLFSMFKTNIDEIIRDQGADLELKKFLELQVAFLKFCIKCYPENIDYVNEILQSCCALCEKKPHDIDEESLKNIVKLLTLPLDSLSIQVLNLDQYPKLMNFLPLPKRRIVSLKIAQAISNSQLCLDKLEIAKQIIEFITPLLKDVDNEYVDLNPYELEEEQQAVCRLIHLIYNEHPDNYL
mmetsp:Transcript_15309/g.13032  ORF Transcript_15309/g.13032 Transcript_15309/m.13032 type:complete len:217 (-) Transcript_15309:1164-1814(-)